MLPFLLLSILRVSCEYLVVAEYAPGDSACATVIQWTARPFDVCQKTVLGSEEEQLGAYVRVVGCQEIPRDYLRIDRPAGDTTLVRALYFGTKTLCEVGEAPQHVRDLLQQDGTAGTHKVGQCVQDANRGNRYVRATCTIDPLASENHSIALYPRLETHSADLRYVFDGEDQRDDCTSCEGLRRIDYTAHYCGVSQGQSEQRVCVNVRQYRTQVYSNGACTGTPSTAGTVTTYYNVDCPVDPSTRLRLREQCVGTPSGLLSPVTPRLSCPRAIVRFDNLTGNFTNCSDSYIMDDLQAKDTMIVALAVALTTTCLCCSICLCLTVASTLAARRTASATAASAPGSTAGSSRNLHRTKSVQPRRSRRGSFT